MTSNREKELRKRETEKERDISKWSNRIVMMRHSNEILLCVCINYMIVVGWLWKVTTPLTCVRHKPICEVISFRSNKQSLGWLLCTKFLRESKIRKHHKSNVTLWSEQKLSVSPGVWESWTSCKIIKLKMNTVLKYLEFV